jgi:hypothetical protein
LLPVPPASKFLVCRGARLVQFTESNRSAEHQGRLMLRLLAAICVGSSASLLRPAAWRRLMLPAILVAATGCGEPNPLSRRAVHGTVTYQGKPVDYGSIQFLPADPQRGISSGAMINEGKYRIKTSDGLPPGSYQVMISSPDRGKQEKVEGPPGDERTLALERIPPKYNLQTTLKLDVPQARGSHEANFELK